MTNPVFTSFRENRAKCHFILGREERRKEERTGGGEEAFTLFPTPGYFSLQVWRFATWCLVRMQGMKNFVAPWLQKIQGRRVAFQCWAEVNLLSLLRAWRQPAGCREVIFGFQIRGGIGQALTESKVISSVGSQDVKGWDHCCLPPLTVFYISVKQGQTGLKCSPSSSVVL